MPREVFEGFIAEVADQYTYDTYDILRNNCNNFTQVASDFLTGNPIPSWIANLPDEVLNTPFGRMIEPMITQWTNNMKRQSMMARGLDPSNFPATQAAFTQQFFPNTPSPAAAPSLAHQPASAPAPAPVTQAPSVNTSTASTAAPHTLRKLLFSDQRPTSFDSIFKQLKLGDATDETVTALRAFFENSTPLPQAAVDALLDAANSCELASGFALLFIIRLVVLDPTENRSFASDPRMVTVIDRFLGTGEVPLPPKAMALLLCTNLFAGHAGQALLLNAHVTAEALGRELASSAEQRRTPASGLLYNYVLLLTSLPEGVLQSQHEDKLWQAVTIVAEVISEAAQAGGAAKLTPAQDEFAWRALSSLFYLVAADESAKELVMQLEVSASINSLASRTPSSKLAQVISDLLKKL